MDASPTQTKLPDTTVSKTCIFDVDFAKQLVNNKKISKVDRDKLVRILKERKRGNELDTFYKLGKYAKHEYLGRWCELRGFGLQTLQGDIRSALAQKYYIDVDMVNAQPTILTQYCYERGWSTSALSTYVQNREELLKEVCDTLQVERYEAKKRIVSILFGGSATGLPDFFVNELEPEMRKIGLNIYRENKPLFKSWVKESEPNYVARAMSYILQTEERKCLEALDKALAKRGRSMDVYIHDGGLVRKRDDEATLSDELLRELEQDIADTTGYQMKLAVKPMVTTYEKEPLSEDAYALMKTEFEQEYMKLMTPPVYIRVVKNDIQMITPANLIHQKQNVTLPDGSSFVHKWVKDPEIRTYERLVFAPKKEVQDDEYNLFTKFAVDPKPVVDVSPVLTLVNLVCDKDPKLMDYVLNCFAQIVQRPYNKLKVCLVIQGKQGCGKDTMINFIGKILGNEFYFSTKNPENNVFHQFNSGTERCVLVKFEEADFKINKQNASKLKAVITQEKETYIRKGQEGLLLDDYRNFIMTTNDEVPILLEPSDRRFVLIKMSDEKVGDTAFWNELYSHLENPDVQAQFHQFLLDRDISTFNAPRDRVVTEFYRDTKQSFTPYHAKFFQEYFHKRDMLDTFEGDTPYVEFKAFHLYEKMKEYVESKFELSTKQFGTHMKLYVDAECIMKKTTNKGAVYYIYPELCKEFLKKQDWYIEI